MEGTVSVQIYRSFVIQSICWLLNNYLLSACWTMED
jgi:hypothetical protein